ncbi:hypothetical protein HXX01_00615 [Candidatus Nomurabacteria bacterium]|nr:hypothetical protein [Candidatus Nomurabacteria bacterium]
MNEIDINKIMQDKKLFNEVVYTSLSDAIKILEKRQKDKNLIKKIDKILNNSIPEPLKTINKNGVIFRQVATPNFEARWFMELTKDHGLKTNFFEYHSDKFTPNNCYKHSLGQLIIHKNKKDKNGGDIGKRITIVDFNKFNGKKIKDVQTFWGDSLISFHKKLFDKYSNKEEDLNFYDASDWFMENGDDAINYYTHLLLLFIYHGILFENFLFVDTEGEFTRNILLPAFKEAVALAGAKPLIVPIPPMDPEIEEDIHWHSYDPKIESLIKLK